MKGLYPQASGEIAIIFLQPGDDYQEVCKRVTPYNTPFLVIEDADLPTDWATSAAWECDFSHPHGVGMGTHRYFIAQAESSIVEINTRVAPTPIEIYEKDAGISDADYAKYVATTTKRNEQLLAAFNAEIAAEIARANALIAQMKAEVLLLEGVQL